MKTTVSTAWPARGRIAPKTFFALVSGLILIMALPSGGGATTSAAGPHRAARVVAQADFARVLLPGDRIATAGIRSAANPCKGCPPACSDSTFNTQSPKYTWPSTTPLPWFFNDTANFPKNLTSAQVQDALIKGANNVVTMKNQCAMPDKVDISVAFQGTTRVTDNMNSSGTGCGNPDGVSVVDFGLVAAGSPRIAGITCNWGTIEHGVPILLESDIRLQAGMPWTTQPQATNCSNKFDLEGIATHERTHSFGMAHADADGSHGNLTMSTFGLGSCSKSYRTFGKGDVLGLQDLYP